MNDVLRTFAVAWLATQAGSLLSLQVGARFVDNRHLLRLGALAHRQKLAALDRLWPLTRVRPAVERGQVGTCTVILSSLIAGKSAASLVFGIVMVFWLPIVSAMVPSIVAVHDPDDPSLGPWVRRVAALQVTSHALAAALGFALVVDTPRKACSVDGWRSDTCLVDRAWRSVARMSSQPRIPNVAGCKPICSGMDAFLLRVSVAL